MNLDRAIPHVRAHRGKRFVIKVGGACVAHPARVAAFAHQAAAVQALGAQVVVVHGAGPQTDALQRELGEEPRKVAGRRVTTPAALRALVRATREELNGALCAALTAEGARAVPAAPDALVARRRPPVVVDGETVDFGAVGDVQDVDVAPLFAALEGDAIPVLGPPASDGNGGLLNVNADLAAAHLAVALRAEKLVLLTEAPGVLADPADPGSLTSALCLEDLAELEQAGALQGGMRVKAAATRLALEGGVPNVHVVSGLLPGALLGELYTTHGTGTWITRDPQGAAPAVAQAAGEAST